MSLFANHLQQGSQPKGGEGYGQTTMNLQPSKAQIGIHQSAITGAGVSTYEDSSRLVQSSFKQPAHSRQTSKQGLGYCAPLSFTQPQLGTSKSNRVDQTERGSFAEGKEITSIPKMDLEVSKGSSQFHSSSGHFEHPSSQKKGPQPTSSRLLPAARGDAGHVKAEYPFPSNRIAVQSTVNPEITKMSQKLINYIKKNEEEKCSVIISKNQADLNFKAENDWTPLHFSCFYGNVKIVNLLLLHCADVNAKARNQLTALMVTCSVGNHQLLNILLTAGANVTDADGTGSTCLHYAAQGGNKFIIQELLDLGLEPDQKNNAGKLPENMTNDQQTAEFIKTKRENNNNMFVPIFSYTFDRIKNMFSSNDVAPPVTIKSASVSKVWPNDFEVLSMLGKGAFGEVYLVRKKDTGIKYAMKVLEKHRVLSQNLLKYALTERKVLSYVNHPFIVGLHFAFQTSDKLCLILDYCSGGDLSKHLKMEKRFSEAKAKLYLAEIVLALQELHRRDIIYRDLKPDNLVLDDDGHCKLTDFGLSKEGVNEHTSGARSFCGSIAYLAPEMLRKTGHGKAVDWYLFGVVFYEMLVGQPPYLAPTKEELFYNIEKGKLRIPAGLSPEAISMVTMLLERDPIRRLGSGPTDAEEIKSHAFFNGIDWDQAYKKRLPVDKPFFKIEEFAKPVDSSAIFLEEGFDSQEGKISGWSFAKK